MARFTHLHVASTFSPNVGTAQPAALVASAAAGGADVAAITDRDGLYGAIPHLRACLAAGIDAMVGVDLALLPDRTDRVLPGDSLPRRVTVLAHGQNRGKGWSALCRLVSRAHESESDGSQRHPSGIGIERSDLRDLIITESTPVATVLLGPDSDVAHAVASADFARAASTLAEWKHLLPGAMAVEVVCHLNEPGDVASIRHAARMLELADLVGVPAVLSNAVRYLRPDAAAPGDMLGAFLSQPDTQAWLKPAVAMRRLASLIVDHSSLRRSAIERLLSTTEGLADTCRLDTLADLAWRRPKVPSRAALRIEADPIAELRRRSDSALLERYAHARPSDLESLKVHLDNEIDMIGRLGLASYVLTVAEVSSLMRSMRVRNQARGSGTGDLVNYLLRISSVDPARHGLLSERPPDSPASRPVIAIDVESNRLDDVYRAIIERFGDNRVALVSHHVSTPPSSLILGADDLLDTTPTQPSSIGLPMSQYATNDLEDVGLLALDVLGSQTQSTLADAVSEIRRIHGRLAAQAGGLPVDAPYVGSDGSIELDEIPLDDEATFESIRTGRTVGMFYIESQSQRERIRTIRPTEFDDLISIESSDDTPKAHCVALAHSTFQSAWIKTHYPAEFLAALLTHDRGTHRRDLLLAEARRMRVPILPIDVNASTEAYRTERIDPPRSRGVLADPDDVILGIRLSLGDVHGMTAIELDRILANRPYVGIDDFYHRAAPSPALLTTLGVVGSLDSVAASDISPRSPQAIRGAVMARVRELTAQRKRPATRHTHPTLPVLVDDSHQPNEVDAERMTVSPRPTEPDGPPTKSGRNAIESYRLMLDELGALPTGDLSSCDDDEAVLVAGTRVATRTLPKSNGERVVAVSLDDGSGCADSIFFDEAQDRAGPLLFGTKLMLIQGKTRHTEDRGISIEASNVWDLKALWAQWQQTQQRQTREAS
ncbi:PHP domain-containing protein [Agreia pratensis]|uniref:PHP domain-containing protein n=1 Tax=Agreia pratensis TaxID=150121 RepID=UPI00188D5455|nr:PHP domain-containing protein [Agreia pratensis]MBF4633740.1 PHP domain-containing protein [Agreia pratensis]